MPISFSCRKCGKKLKAPDSAAGKSSKCPGCGATVTCPEPVYEAEPIVSDVPDILPDDPYGLDDSKPYGLDEDNVQPLPSAEPRRPCPMCGEMILASAAKCRFCGEVFDETLKKSEVKKKKKKKRKSSDPDAENLSAGDWIAAILCSDFACIASIIWMIQGKPKGLKMLGVSLLSIAIRIPIILALQSKNQGIPGGP